jgi:hypothetical protein
VVVSLSLCARAETAPGPDRDLFSLPEPKRAHGADLGSALAMPLPNILETLLDVLA